MVYFNPEVSEYGTFLHNSANAEDDRLRTLRKKRMPHLRTQYEELPEYIAMHSQARIRLERFDRALEYMFEHGGVRLGHLQHKLMNAVRMCALKRIFGNELLANLDWIRERYGIRDTYNVACILFPRRSGKTTVQAIAAAVIAVSQEDGNTVTFNISGRQSRAWLKACIQFIERFKESRMLFFIYTYLHVIILTFFHHSRVWIHNYCR